MFNRTEKETFEALKKQHSRVLMYQEFPSDLITPLQAAAALKSVGEEIMLLESAEKQEDVGRLSFIGFEPKAELRASGLSVTIKRGEELETKEGDPFESLRALLKEFKSASDKHFPGFVGGCVGYMAYDAIRYIEDIPDRHLNDKEMPDLFFRFFDQGILFDYQKGLVVILSIHEEYEAGMAAIEVIKKAISKGAREAISPVGEHPVSVDMSDEEYAEVVKKGQKYIVDGDIFQFVPSRTFNVPYYSSPFHVYRSLCYTSPAPYMVFFEMPEAAIVVASPEKLVSMRGDQLETIPLAGTRKRGQGNVDLERQEELLADEKEVAEHMMLVDLGRNDLGRVSKQGTVKVDRLKQVLKFSHVMHIASFVTGIKKDEFDAIDVLKAAFPAGTLSGAPKIRAMEIIDELEISRRGLYGGAIVMIDHKGDLESCIAIRMALLKDGIAKIRAGAGVVYDSDPLAEANETKAKAEAIIDAIIREGDI